MTPENEKLKLEIEALKKEKFSLLKIISHDIRSPFNRLFALLQLFEMESKEPSDAQRQYTDSMYLSLLSGLEMIQNLKDLRELDFNTLEIHQEEKPVNEIFHNIIRTFSQRMQLKNQTIAYDESSALKVKGDAFLIGRIIENLVSNALKFSPPGKETKVICQVSADNFEIAVRDDGVGIKPEEEPMLFKKFSKLSSIATGGEGSLGLGLYNAQHFAKLMQGDILFKRTNKRGAEFVLQLPV